MTLRASPALVLALVWLAACSDAPPDSDESDARDGGAAAAGPPEIALDFEQYELDNGLDVILHVDRSDPVAAVLMTFHVGSAREVPNRTGFAHLFEHLFFLDSENLGPGGLDRLMTRVGSATNGSTDSDYTNYYEVVPVDALEKTLWAESDKLGFFINTVTQSVLDKEKQVVKNEKRQSYDNAPYGHTFHVVHKAMFPAEHPYSWPAIGSVADLDAAALEDVHEFHRRWYGPNNATLTIAGDIDVEQTKAWIERYFGEIPERPTPDTAPPPPIGFDESARLFHEDNFAELPELTLSWPSAPLYHEDSHALDVLAALLADGKQTPLYEAIVEEAQLAPDVRAGNAAGELAGRFTVTVRAHADTDLDAVFAAVVDALERFEREGPSAAELDRVKAGYEADFYASLSSVLGKSYQLTQYSLFAPSTDHVNADLAGLIGVTAADVVRVYERYIAERPFVATSFVPRGAPALALEGSVRADVVEEPIVPGEGEVVLTERGDVPRTASIIDRAVEPPFGEAPRLSAPDVETLALDNGLGVYVIEDAEAPLVEFSLRVRGGLLAEDPEAAGVANLLAEIMTEGTAERTPEELELAIDELGASIDVSAGLEYLTIRGSVLARNFTETMALVEEILLEPRWDPERFALARERVRSTLRARAGDPVALADDTFRRLVYGDHVLARSPLGALDTIESVTLDDAKAYYARALGPSNANLHVAGAVAPAQVADAARSLATRWEARDVELPASPRWDDERSGLYFVDVPGSAQSVLTIGYLGPAQTDTEFYPAEIMNFRFGGGGFASDLTQVLREQYGYTYRIRSAFQGTALPGPFRIQSSVRSNVTLESLELIKDLMGGHGAEFDEMDLDATQSFLLKSNALAFETLGAKLGVLEDMSAMGFEADYVLEREQVVRSMTIERIRELAESHLDPVRMVWLVVGDAATQRDRLDALGLGEATLIAP